MLTAPHQAESDAPNMGTRAGRTSRAGGVQGGEVGQQVAEAGSPPDDRQHRPTGVVHRHVVRGAAGAGRRLEVEHVRQLRGISSVSRELSGDGWLSVADIPRNTPATAASGSSRSRTLLVGKLRRQVDLV
jgi:hypothetical protein